MNISKVEINLNFLSKNIFVLGRMDTWVEESDSHCKMFVILMFFFYFKFFVVPYFKNIFESLA